MLSTKEVGTFTMEDAKELARQIERYDAAIKVMKQKLRSFVDLNGGVEVDGKTWAVHENNKWVFTPDSIEKLMDVMIMDKKNPFDYLTLTAESLKKLKYSDEVLKHFGTKEKGKGSFRALKNENIKN